MTATTAAPPGPVVEHGETAPRSDIPWIGVLHTAAGGTVGAGLTAAGALWAGWGEAAGVAAVVALLAALAGFVALAETHQIGRAAGSLTEGNRR